ncbi:MAG: hypothetical protein ACW98X_17770 [Promethearchaeota archaeon]|jgi:hypothetical protein
MVKFEKLAVYEQVNEISKVQVRVERTAKLLLDIDNCLVLVKTLQDNSTIENYRNMLAIQLTKAMAKHLEYMEIHTVRLDKQEMIAIEKRIDAVDEQILALSGVKNRTDKQVESLFLFEKQRKELIKKLKELED